MQFGQTMHFSGYNTLAHAAAGAMHKGGEIQRRVETTEERLKGLMLAKQRHQKLHQQTLGAQTGQFA